MADLTTNSRKSGALIGTGSLQSILIICTIYRVDNKYGILVGTAKINLFA